MFVVSNSSPQFLQVFLIRAFSLFAAWALLSSRAGLSSGSWFSIIWDIEPLYVFRIALMSMHIEYMYTAHSRVYMQYIRVYRY